MTRPHSYCPPLPPPPAAPIRVATCDTLSHTFRETYTATAQHLRGRRWLHTSATAHWSLFTAHWTYTFSAKEKDSETGLSYFGSRYYSSDLSIWLSVDPQASKYPSLSPYTYCADNPVKLVDPNGEEIDDNLDKWKYNRDTKKLTWVSNTGGKYHQTVVETNNTSEGEKVYRTVDFDGAIGRMFDFSVFNSTIDGLINGAYNVRNGVATFAAGVTVGAATEGAGTAVATGICFYGACQAGEGLKTAMDALAGKMSDPYGQQDIIKDVLNTSVNTGSGVIRKIINNTTKLFKYVFNNVSVSFVWSAAQYYRASHPKYIDAPKGSTIKYQQK